MLIRMTGHAPQRYVELSRLAPGTQYRLVPSYYGLELFGITGTYEGGAKDGEPVAAELVAGQKVQWDLGILFPTKALAHLEVHPKLYSLGNVRFPRIAEPGESLPLIIRLAATQGGSLGGLDWLVRLYFID